MSTETDGGAFTPYETLPKRPRIVGPNMRRACAYVAAHPGCSIIDVARHLLPGPLAYPSKLSSGFNTVHLCIDAGLIRSRHPKRRLGDHSPYQLEITATGSELATEETRNKTEEP